MAGLEARIKKDGLRWALRQKRRPRASSFKRRLGCTPSAAPFEELHFPLVLLSCSPRGEGAKVPPLPSLGILLEGVESILA